MARGVRLTGERAWTALGLALLLPALALAWAPSAWQDAAAWQPDRAWREPWRALSAAWVHLSVLHLAANAAGTLVVTALGRAVGVSARAAAAWAAAWPLTHLSLLLQPELLRYGGLSGVLHAGVAVAAVQLLGGAHALARPRTARALGAAVLAGLLLKVLGEAPWAAPVPPGEGWDIPIATLAHATGAAWGLLLGAAALAGRGRAPIRT